LAAKRQIPVEWTNPELRKHDVSEMVMPVPRMRHLR
jgi:hypothetical protein